MDTVMQLRERFQRELPSIQSLQNLESLTVTYLGRNGEINALLKQITNIADAERKQFGQEVNKLKKEIEESLAAVRHKLVSVSDEQSTIDPTLPGTPYPRGSLHVTTYAIEEITKIFAKIGFVRMSYPEIDWEYEAFEALNMPSDHPARDDFETFFINNPAHETWGKMVLTPHTSNGQNREMKRLEGKPPIRMINIAKTYRPNWDVTHVPMFHQFEGMCVDKDINISHLKGTLDYFVKAFFGEKRSARIRPFHFQFTEPSFEVDVSCGICFGKGCKVCKSGWLELGGAGMIHPNVLKEGGIDPNVYTGFAFGWGVERVFAMREDFKLDDLRVLYNGDIRFLEQF